MNVRESRGRQHGRMRVAREAARGYLPQEKIGSGENLGASPFGFLSKASASKVAHEECSRKPAPKADALIALEDLKAARIQVLKLFKRIERHAEKVDEAFAGAPFLPELSPDAPANKRRFNAYLKAHSQVSKLLWRAVELWMIACGMTREDG